MINVTKPFLPPLSEFLEVIPKIWDSKILTNCGPYHQELEKKLAEFLGVPYISLFCNATIGLYAAIKVLDLKGEVITTPFTFAATSDAIVLNGLEPVFIDTSLSGVNIDPWKIEAQITDATSLILPVHCYGVPCDVEQIAKLAEKYNLRVIYDAAHAFAVECSKGSILNFGDMSVLSFHATKVFNTFEGGAVISNNIETKTKLDMVKNFGILGEDRVDLVGLNGKMSEINCALGILQLRYIESAIHKRAEIYKKYKNVLSECKHLEILDYDVVPKANYAYMPIFVKDSQLFSRDKLHDYLESLGIKTRKYFYPLLIDTNAFINYAKKCPNAKSLSQKVLCLPIYPDLTNNELVFIINSVMNYFKNDINGSI
jgi:dTDP-4-amino-4,6-dideoxygalactose transaminase